ncbi:hypothetical protein FB639_006531, partial [Coemansia asiatica]
MLLSISQFPLLGSGIYIDKQSHTNGKQLRSLILSESCLNPMQPFTLEIAGIIDRRGIVPYTAVPVFHDKSTAWPFVDHDLSSETLDFGILQSTVGVDGSCHGTRNNSIVHSTNASPGFAAACNVNATFSAAASTQNNSTEAAASTKGSDSWPYAVTPSPRPPMFEMPSNKNCLLLDSPLFGIGSGGVLRVTLCAADLDEARTLYDQLAPICAIM